MPANSRHYPASILRLITSIMLLLTLGAFSTGCDLNPFASDTGEAPQPATEPSADTPADPGNPGGQQQIPDDAFQPDPEAGGDRESTQRILVEAGTQEPRTINPVLVADPLSDEISRLVFNGLTSVDPQTGEPVPDLAERWEISGDGATVTFHLREDVTWHDGQPFTAQDVEFTYELMMNEETRSPRYSRLVERITAVEATGEYRVEFRLAAPYAPLLTTLTTFGIVPQHVLSDVLPEELVTDPFGISHAIGTGPFALSEWDRGMQLSFRANASYHHGPPAVDRYEYRVALDEDEILAGIANRSIDWARISAERVADAREIEGGETHSIPSFEMISVVLKLEHGRMLFDDQRVREALLRAVDRNRIVQEIWHGHAHIAQGTLPPASPAFQEAGIHYNYDPEQAETLLDEAGWVRNESGVRSRDGQTLSFALIANGDNPRRRALAEQLVDDWQAIGVDATVQFETWGTVQEQIRTSRDFSALLFGYRWEIDPDQHAMWASDSIPDAFNLAGYVNRDVDQALNEALSMEDIEERNSTYHLVQDMVMADLPILPLVFPNQTFVTGPRLHDIALTAILVRNRATIDEWVPVETEQQEEPES